MSRDQNVVISGENAGNIQYLHVNNLGVINRTKRKDRLWPNVFNDANNRSRRSSLTVYVYCSSSVCCVRVDTCPGVLT